MTTISAPDARAIIANSWPEKQLLQAVSSFAQALKWRAYHTWRSDHSAAGFPDLVMCRGSRGLAVELKSEKGRVTDAQREWLAAFALAGFETAVWRPSDWLRGECERVLM